MEKEKLEIISELLSKCDLFELENISRFIMRQVDIERQKRSNNLMISQEKSQTIIRALEKDTYY